MRCPLSRGSLSISGFQEPSKEAIVNTLEAIAARRSIRRFKSEPLDRAMVERLLTAAIQAPSGKNRQPWRFVVLTEDARTHLAELIERSCDSIRGQGGNTGSAPATAASIRQAPATIVFFQLPIPEEWRSFQGAQLIDFQAIGAAIQNVCLAATDLGLGSLWIADIFYAHEAVMKWLAGPEEHLVAALSIGHPDEVPDARPRRSVEETAAWKTSVE
jgi:nitroreductase